MKPEEKKWGHKRQKRKPKHKYWIKEAGNSDYRENEVNQREKLTRSTKTEARLVFAFPLSSGPLDSLLCISCRVRFIL